ncbi:UDP-N-acetylmuramoyl-tripeptide--D-alanyl-D-alanine ligase [Mesonia hippocampi]|uniref:UDP-N-acetylmuramoyl-tripeptide--D-alanyl-D-alanine ligase n=1 Tax=Mesonia hippocampi TaxID=1628250 RepID=A0A840ER67_9FLAO|nr:UDP-N-acetylmuramoyl-tripeptide--D-alanyl-D-alanine ligase [Mesonia hippocampi]MBB4119460.1 UDP-N-acetylmuramoyl-tripeptide--D-alanyl-D-alanine ligase [Mesonia hippocampi]
MSLDKLHQIFLNSTGVSTDTRNITKGNLFFALSGGNFNGNKFAKEAIEKGASMAIIDDKDFAINEKYILVDNSLKTLQELAKFHRNQLDIPIIAITGSNGKTTTKELITSVLQQKFNTQATIGNLNNHIGVPLTLLSMTTETEIGVVEMGANHQKEIEFLCTIAQPNYGYITNFGKAHLEGFGGFEGVIKGKSELYDYLIKNNLAIFINLDDKIQVEQSKNGKVISFSETALKSNYQIKLHEVNPFVSINTNNLRIQSRLIGLYNAKNIAAAISIGLHFKVPLKDIKTAIENYTPTNNRSQIINKNGNYIILDAYNANPTSMEAALKNLNAISKNNKTVILGDMFEVGNTSELEHQKIIDLLEEYNFSEMLVCGTHFYQAKSTKVKKFKNYEALADYLTQHRYQENTILIKGSRGMQLERALDLL